MKKLYRSRRNKKLFGLCGGVSEVMGVDATLLRVLAIVIAVFSSGTFILVYILAALVVPKEPPYYDGFGPGPGGFGSYGSGFGQNHTPGGGYYNTQTPPPSGQGWNNWQPPHSSHQTPPQSPSNLDKMMEDLEKKALQKELDELKAKLAKYEKGE